MRPAVFLDKDGTLVEDVPYSVDPARIVLRPGAIDALRLLARLGYELVVVSNQPGVALGRFPFDALRGMEDYFIETFTAHGVRVAGYCWCPHHPDGIVERFAYACVCRKPKPGMLHAAAIEHGLDLRRSWMVGDILDDVEAGHRAGCRSVLVDAGNETEWKRGLQRIPDFTVPDLLSAAAIIEAARSLTLRETIE